ncbi:MAG: S8 family peptidase [Bacteroidetes bacterium]|nr:S8 family peptidase [Bacteroidota bacterium]
MIVLSVMAHVAGIACGNGLAVNNYKGVAPKADIIIVKSNLNQPDADFLTSLVEAIKYIFDKADQMGEPAVINISLGTYFGSHDGKDIQAQSIDNLISSAPGHVVVCSAGNAGTAPLHLGYTLNGDTNYTWLQQSSNYVYIQAWGDSGSFENANFALAIERIKPDYTTLASLPFTNILSYPDSVITDTLWSGSNRLGIVQYYAQNLGDRYSFEYLIYPDSSVNINGNDTTRYFWKFMTTGSGRMDAWSYDMVFDNLPDSLTLPSITKYKKPDTDQTIVSSFTCSDKVITVGSYINRNYYTNVNYTITRDTTLQVGELSTFSSHGPTRDGRIKPDITATGEWILSCSTQAELNILAATEPEKVAAGKKHKRSSGTSMSAPVVAGIAALYLQKNPSAMWSDVKTAILGCADRDQFTGSNLPDNYWGYGKVNGYGVVKGCSIGIDEIYDSPVGFSFYPNPSASETMFAYDLSALPTYHRAYLEVTDAMGRTVQSIPLKGLANSIEISKGTLNSGLYFCSLRVDGKIMRTGKLVIL